jgi:hypothetical protein
MQHLGLRARRMCKTFSPSDVLLNLLHFLLMASVGTQVVDRGVAVGWYSLAGGR